MAIRNFGTEAKPVLFLVKPSPASGVVQISLVEDGSNERGYQENAKLSFGGGAPLKIDQLRYGADKKKVRMINLGDALAARLATVDKLGWSAPHTDYVLELGPMASVMKVLGRCREGLRGHWNGTEEQRAALRDAPKPQKPLYMLFSSDDYPDDAIRPDKSGMASVVLLIDEKGQIADCMIDETSGVAVLDAQSCIILRKRAKFSPAIGPDGKPVRSTFAQRIRWLLP